jgi:large subunit ribosomal protein L21
MYAVFEDGSRQYRVQEGDVVKVDFRAAEIGASLEFTRVLLFQNDADTRIGQPVIEGARVVAEVVDHPSTKLYIQHFRRRKNYRRLKGHRQPYTSIKIQKIVLPEAN